MIFIYERILLSNESMKILFDHQTFTLQKYGGISRYFYEIIRRFETKGSIEAITSLFLSNNYYISENKDIKHIDFFPTLEFKGKGAIGIFINKLVTVINIKNKRFDIFHPTYYDPYFLRHIGDKPFVLTVHDMIHEKFSDNFPRNDKTSIYKRELAEKAAKIIAISDSTKNDLIELFDISPDKIEVVYHGNSMVVNDAFVFEPIFNKKYILFVGARGSYKNFDRFIISIASLLDDSPNLRVICVGGGSFIKSELLLFKNLKIEKQILQYTLDDNSLAHFYKNATLFVFPSLYEGFGIPILESFACGCPLVCSNTSSFPEIAGNGAEYFDPYDEISILSSVKYVLNNSERRVTLVGNGNERLKCFSWEKAFESTKKVYEDVMKENEL
jgi:glycosyltransferase involved in cell wall biosynthesis